MIIEYVKDDWLWRFPQKVKYNRYRGLSRPAFVFWCFLYYVIKDALILYFYFAFRFFKFVFWDIWNWIFKIDERVWFIHLKEKLGIYNDEEVDDETDYEEDIDVLYDADDSVEQVSKDSNKANRICGGRCMKKSIISFDEKMSWWKGDFFVDDIITLAMDKAYRDLMRTIRGFAYNQEHDVIIRNARETLYSSITAILSSEVNTQSDFDRLHKSACYDLILSFGEQAFTVGQAQKWINMTFKYLHLLDYSDVQKVYEYCHVPIDNYMLNITNYSMSKAWSKLNDYQEYLEYQNWFRTAYPNDIPLDKEFYLWLEEARRSRGDNH